MDDEIASIGERELGVRPARVIRVAEGLLHETYRLRYDDAEYVLQFSSDVDDDREDSLRRGLNCYALLRDSEIPVPEVVTESAKEYNGGTYTLVETLPGKTGERDVSPERTRNAGRYLAKIHDARGFETAGWIQFEGRTPSVSEFGAGSLKRWIRREVKENARLLREGGVSGESELETVAEELEALFDREGEGLPETFDPVLCHDDYSPDNVLFRDGEVTGILDFDRAYAGHGQRDLAKAANCFWMHDPCSDWDPRAALYEGYRDVRGLDSSFEQNEPLYRAETLAGIVAGMLEMDELPEYETAFYAERLLEAIERVERT